MLTGWPPFYDKNLRKMCEQILKSDLHFPTGCAASADARDFIRGLLQRDPAQRLGSRAGGVGDIRAHPFFRGVDWERMEKGEVEPPFQPKVESDTDITNFDSTFTNEPAVLTPPAPSELSEVAAAGDDFADFGYVNASKLVSMLGALPSHLVAKLTSDDRPAKAAAAAKAAAEGAGAGGGAGAGAGSGAGAGTAAEGDGREDSVSKAFVGFDGAGSGETERASHDVQAVAAELTRLSESGVR